MVMWSQTIHDLLPELPPGCVCCIGQLRPTLPQERDFAMKTPAVSAGCLQYKHSQGSRREVGWQWEQRGAWKDWGTRDTGKGRETSSGKEAETPPSCIEHYKKHGCSPHDCGCVRGSDCISEMICSCKFQTGTCYLFFPFFCCFGIASKYYISS